LTPESLLDGIVPLRVGAAAIKRHPATVKRWADKPGGPKLIYIGRFPHLNLVKLLKWIEGNVRVVAEPKPVRRGRPRTRP
jgi:hypothetical protein